MIIALEILALLFGVTALIALALGVVFIGILVMDEVQEVRARHRIYRK